MATRVYELDGLQVLWDSRRCVHAAACIRAQPAVFNPLVRPWIRMENGTTELIIAAVEACPTGALRYVRPDGTGEAPPPGGTTIAPIPDGPLVMRGDLCVIAPSGALVTRETRLAFCRCGGSENQPYCDNSHRRIGFHSQDGGVEDVHAWAESPADIAPPQPETFR